MTLRLEVCARVFYNMASLHYAISFVSWIFSFGFVQVQGLWKSIAKNSLAKWLLGLMTERSAMNKCSRACMEEGESWWEKHARWSHLRGASFAWCKSLSDLYPGAALEPVFGFSPKVFISSCIGLRMFRMPIFTCFLTSMMPLVDKRI